MEFNLKHRTHPQITRLHQQLMQNLIGDPEEPIDPYQNEDHDITLSSDELDNILVDTSDEPLHEPTEDDGEIALSSNEMESILEDTSDQDIHHEDLIEPYDNPNLDVDATDSATPENNLESDDDDITLSTDELAGIISDTNDTPQETEANSINTTEEHNLPESMNEEPQQNQQMNYMKQIQGQRTQKLIFIMILHLQLLYLKRNYLKQMNLQGQLHLANL